jgi:flagellin
MALTISTSTSSLQSQKQLNASNRALEKNVATLSSGRRINSAQDDAAGLAIALQMSSDVSTLKQASSNLVQGTSLLQTADGALEQSSNILNRMKELSTQANSGSLDSNSRTAINDEYQNLKSELNDIGSTTTFNGQPVVNGTYNNDFQAGASGSDVLNADLTAINVSAAGLGLTAGAGDSASALLTQSSAQTTSSELDNAIQTLSSQRAQVGALQSSFSTRNGVVDTEIENTISAQSAIIDADLGKAVSEFKNSKLLNDVALSAAAQGNKMSASFLKLVRQ